MPITIKWVDDTKQCIHQRYVGTWTADDLRTMHQQVIQMCKTVTYDVHRIVDLSESDPPPEGLLVALRKAASISDVRPSIIIFVNKSLSLKYIIDIYSGLFSMFVPKIYKVRTLEEALTIMNKVTHKECSELNSETPAG